MRQVFPLACCSNLKHQPEGLLLIHLRLMAHQGQLPVPVRSSRLHLVVKFSCNSEAVLNLKVLHWHSSHGCSHWHSPLDLNLNLKVLHCSHWHSPLDLLVIA